MTESSHSTPDPDPASTPTPAAPTMPSEPTDPGPTIDARSPLDELIELGAVRDSWANMIAYLVLNHEPIEEGIVIAYGRADHRYRALVDLLTAAALS